jgi:hypothetical protein
LITLTHAYHAFSERRAALTALDKGYANQMPESLSFKQKLSLAAISLRNVTTLIDVIEHNRVVGNVNDTIEGTRFNHMLASYDSIVELYELLHQSYTTAEHTVWMNEVYTIRAVVDLSQGTVQLHDTRVQQMQSAAAALVDSIDAFRIPLTNQLAAIRIRIVLRHTGT